jgi:hypothetical protein
LARELSSFGVFLYGLQNTSKQTSGVSAPQPAASGTALIARNGLVICRVKTVYTAVL